MVDVKDVSQLGGEKESTDSSVEGTQHLFDGLSAEEVDGEGETGSPLPASQWETGEDLVRFCAALGQALIIARKMNGRDKSSKATAITVMMMVKTRPSPTAKQMFFFHATKTPRYFLHSLALTIFIQAIHESSKLHSLKGGLAIHGHSYTLKLLPVLFSSLVEYSIIIFSAVLLLTCPHISTAVTVTMRYPSSS